MTYDFLEPSFVKNDKFLRLYGIWFFVITLSRIYQTLAGCLCVSRGEGKLSINQLFLRRRSWLVGIE